MVDSGTLGYTIGASPTTIHAKAGVPIQVKTTITGTPGEYTFVATATKVSP